MKQGGQPKRHVSCLSMKFIIVNRCGHSESEFPLLNPQMYYLLYDLPHSRFAINAICFSQDGCLLASGDDDGYIRLFDFRLGKELRKVRVLTSVTSLLWHPNKPGVIFIGDARGIVTVMNLHAEVSESVVIVSLSPWLMFISSTLKLIVFVLVSMLQQRHWLMIPAMGVSLSQ